jgi:hypothetical protein
MVCCYKRNFKFLIKKAACSRCRKRNQIVTIKLVNRKINLICQTI